MKDLEDIDTLYAKIEDDIAALAKRESKEIAEIDSMLEALAEDYTDVETGGLDKIVERDDEGGGEQADDEDCTQIITSLAEEVNNIHKLKKKLQVMIESYEAKITVCSTLQNTKQQ